MDTTTLIILLVSLFTCLCSGGLCFLFFLMILGFIILRRRGKKVEEVTAKEAFDVGMETATGVFRRSQMDDGDQG